MQPVFAIGSVQISAYWAMAALGAVCAALYVARTLRRWPVTGITHTDTAIAALLALLGAYLGGRLLYALVQLPPYLHLLFTTPQVLPGGFFPTLSIFVGGSVFYGGLGGADLSIWAYCRLYKVPAKSMFAVVTPAFPLFHAFGRVGCFFAGCCYGIPVSWGLPLHSSLAPGGRLFPVQLVEATVNLALFIFLAAFVRRQPSGKKHLVLPLYFLLYGAARFVLEFFRGDASRGVYFLSTSQWIALASVVIVLAWGLHRRHSTNSKSSPPAHGSTQQ